MLTNSNIVYCGNRDYFITQYVRNKSVLHVGACDSPYHLEKIESGQWLHSKLMVSAEKVIGVDLDAEAVESCKKKGYDNIVCSDALNLPKNILQDIDVIIAGEIIEHLLSPGNFLSGLYQLMSENQQLLISTPNILSIFNFINAVRNKENVHPDHMCGFTPRLLEQLAISTGFKVQDILGGYLSTTKMGVLGKSIRKLPEIVPLLSETIIVVLKKEQVAS